MQPVPWTPTSRGSAELSRRLWNEIGSRGRGEQWSLLVNVRQSLNAGCCRPDPRSSAAPSTHRRCASSRSPSPHRRRGCPRQWRCGVMSANQARSTWTVAKRRRMWPSCTSGLDAFTRPRRFSITEATPVYRHNRATRFRST